MIRKIHKGASRPPSPDCTPTFDPVDTFEGAIEDIIASTFALTAAIANVAYADGARARSDLERALSYAQALAEHLPVGPDRADALHRLVELQAVATRMLMLAPAPSSAAIEAARGGDDTALQCEEHAWIASRLARGSSPDLRAPHRARRDTRPESPRALRDTHGGESDVLSPTVPTESLSLDVSLDLDDER